MHCYLFQCISACFWFLSIFFCLVCSWNCRWKVGSNTICSHYTMKEKAVQRKMSDSLKQTLPSFHIDLFGIYRKLPSYLWWQFFFSNFSPNVKKLMDIMYLYCLQKKGKEGNTCINKKTNRIFWYIYSEIFIHWFGFFLFFYVDQKKMVSWQSLGSEYFTHANMKNVFVWNCKHFYTLKNSYTVLSECNIVLYQ